MDDGEETASVSLNDLIDSNMVKKQIRLPGFEYKPNVKPGRFGNQEVLENDDDIIDYFMDNNKDWQICRFYLTGTCMYGDKCHYFHPKSEQTRDFFKDRNMGYQGGEYTEPAYDYDDDGNIVGDEDCVICLEKVLANGRRFGILQNCSHAFCLDCIRNWRATFDKKIKKTHYRTCPICRTNSYLVIPSDYMIYDLDFKEQLLEEYQERLDDIPCKHFNFGKGYCPFQNSCFYAHLLENGDRYEYPWKQRFMDDDGTVFDISE